MTNDDLCGGAPIVVALLAALPWALASYHFLRIRRTGIGRPEEDLEAWRSHVRKGLIFSGMCAALILGALMVGGTVCA